MMTIERIGMKMVFDNSQQIKYVNEYKKMSVKRWRNYKGERERSE